MNSKENRLNSKVKFLAIFNPKNVVKRFWKHVLKWIVMYLYDRKPHYGLFLYFSPTPINVMLYQIPV